MSKTKMSDRGRAVIPAEVRQAMGLKEGDAALWSQVDRQAREAFRAQRIRQAQALVRKHVPAGVFLADELIAQRKQEAPRG